MKKRYETRMKRETQPVDKLFYEHEMLALGAQYIAGVDEVGRGPLAGPVVCAAVILPLEKKYLIDGIDDSKKLKESERERLAELIRERAVAHKICEADSGTIDRINILQATKLCMKRAVEGLSVEPDVVFVDGNCKIDISFPQQTLIKGDALSYTIGAASILAKVYRDRLMCELDKVYPQATASLAKLSLLYATSSFPLMTKSMSSFRSKVYPPYSLWTSIDLMTLDWSRVEDSSYVNCLNMSTLPEYPIISVPSVSTTA